MYSQLEERQDFKNWKQRKILSLRLGSVITMVPLAIEIMQAIMMRRFIFSSIIGTLILALFGLYFMYLSLNIQVVDCFPVVITDKKKRYRRKKRTSYYLYSEQDCEKIKASCTYTQYKTYEIGERVLFFKTNKESHYFALALYDEG